MRKLLVGLAALLISASIASAAELLSDAQLDRVAAGIAGQIALPALSLPAIQCASDSCVGSGPVTPAQATPIPIGLSFSDVVANFVAQVVAAGYPQ
jgi:hypothetical protein